MKIKKITAILIAFAMCLTSLSALAYETWVENGAISITPVTMADGSELTDVSAGQTITLNAQVKKGSTAADGQTAQMLIVAYKEGLVKQQATSTKITVTNDKQPLTATITVPSDADALKVFVLDGRETRRPIAQAGVVGGSSVKVSGIYLDGEMLEGFSPDKYSYNVTLNAAYMNYPEIVVQTDDILAKTEIVCADSFPSENASVTARVTKNGNVKAEYTINFTRKEPKITNIKYRETTGGEYIDIDAATNTVILAEPQNFEGEITKDAFYNADVATLNATITTDPEDLPTDRIDPRSGRAEMALYNISPELLGGTMIKMPFDKVVDDYAEGAALTFDINRSATVYVYAQNTNGQNNLADKEGFVIASGSPSYYYNSLPVGNSGDSAVGDVLAFIFQAGTGNSAGQASRARIKAWAKKDIIVDPSVGTATVKIPSSKAAYYAAVVKFHDAPLVLNPKVTTVSVTQPTATTVLRNVFEPVMLDGEVTDANFFEKSLYYPNVFSDRVAVGAGITEFEDDIVGAEAILLPYTDDITKLEFELNHSAKVYLVSANGALPESQPSSAWISSAAPTGKELVSQYANNETLTDITATNTTVEKEYQVVPGETVKVEIDNFPTGRVFVFVKRIELE